MSQAFRNRELGIAETPASDLLSEAYFLDKATYGDEPPKGVVRRPEQIASVTEQPALQTQTTQS